MGVYYLWACDERREYFDPESMPYYGNKYPAIPHSAWLLAVLCLGDWYGRPVKLINDSADQDLYYSISSRTVEEAAVWSGPGPYRNVTRAALGKALELGLIPDEALLAIAVPILGAVAATTTPGELLLEQVRKAFSA